MKALTKKGFTLAELLIVMAIVVVLAAIAIPTFGKQLETARETSDANAIRAAATDAFSEVYSKNALTGINSSVIKSSESITFRQTNEGWDYISPTIAIGSSDVGMPNVTKGTGTVAFTFSQDDSTGKIYLSAMS